MDGFYWEDLKKEIIEFRLISDVGASHMSDNGGGYRTTISYPHTMFITEGKCKTVRPHIE
jgi:hypothetical protein